MSPRDPTRYAVRAYDVGAGQLLAKPIVDPNEEGPDEMRGYPLTRTVSPDGRWAYTLSDGTGQQPFIHALDISQGRAVSIDTPSLARRRALDRLNPDHRSDGSALTGARKACRERLVRITAEYSRWQQRLHEEARGAFRRPTADATMTPALGTFGAAQLVLLG